MHTTDNNSQPMFIPGISGKELEAFEPPKLMLFWSNVREILGWLIVLFIFTRNKCFTI